MLHFAINNFTAEISRTGLESGKLPTDDYLYSYFSVSVKKEMEEYFLLNKDVIFGNRNLYYLKRFAKNDWKNRDRKGCIEEFISNMTWSEGLEGVCWYDDSQGLF